METKLKRLDVCLVEINKLVTRHGIVYELAKHRIGGEFCHEEYGRCYVKNVDDCFDLEFLKEWLLSNGLNVD